MWTSFGGRGYGDAMFGLSLHRRGLPLVVAVLTLGSAGCGDDGGSGSGGSADGSGSDGATAATSTTGNAGDDETTGPPEPDMGLQPPTVCESMCATRGACGQSEVACVNTCDADYGNFESEPAPCLSDFEALLTCVGGLSCEDIDLFDAADGDMYPCAAENDAFTTSCLLGGMMPPATCEAYCGVLTMCTDVTAPECDAVCTAQLQFAEGLSKACAASTTSLLDCVGAVADCAEYDAYDQSTPDDPCAAEAAAAETDCAM